MPLKEPENACDGIGVYCIESGLTGNTYYGSSQNVGRRLKNHASLLKAGKHVNAKLQKEFDQGHPLATNTQPCNTREEAYALEQSILDDAAESPYLLNLSLKAKGTSVPGMRQSAEFCARQKENSTRIMQDPLKREQVSLFMKGNQHALGTVRTKESMVASAKATSKPIVADGVWYPSSSEASKQTGLASGTVHNRLNSATFPNWTYSVHHQRPPDSEL